MRHSHSILTFKLLIPLLPTSYLLTTASCSWLFLYTFCFLFSLDSLRVLQWNAGGLRARSTKLLHLFRLIPLTLFVSRNPTLIYLSLSRFLDSLLCDLIAPTPGLVFFLLMPRTLAAALSFLSGRAYPPLTFLPPLFLRLTPYSDYVGVNISLNNFSSLSFLNVYATPIRSSPRDSRTDFFFSSILPFFRNFFILGGTSTTMISSATQKVLPTPVGRRYSIGSSPLTSSMTLIYLLFFIAPLAVATILTSFCSLLSCPLLFLGDDAGPGF